MVLFARDTSLDINSPYQPLFSSPHNCPFNPPPRHSRLQQPAVGLLPRCYLIGEGVSLLRITERPFVLGRCPASDTQWRPLPSGSAPGRRGPGRSYRPATTKDTWRSGDRRRRWVRPVRASQCHVVSVACVMDSGVGGQRVCVCTTPADPSPPLLHSRRAVNFLIVFEWERLKAGAGGGRRT